MREDRSNEACNGDGRPSGRAVRLSARGASAVVSHPAAMLGVVGAMADREVLGLDFETTGIDRFNDVPVSYALVSVVEGVVVRSWSGLIDPGREIPPEATEVHGISTERAERRGHAAAGGDLARLRRGGGGFRRAASRWPA